MHSVQLRGDTQQMTVVIISLNIKILVLPFIVLCPSRQYLKLPSVNKTIFLKCISLLQANDMVSKTDKTQNASSLVSRSTYGLSCSCHLWLLNRRLRGQGSSCPSREVTGGPFVFLSSRGAVSSWTQWLGAVNCVPQLTQLDSPTRNCGDVRRGKSPHLLQC